MNDLVERLNKETDCIGTGAGQFIMREAAAEIARLRARPTEEAVAKIIKRSCEQDDDWAWVARNVLALFPKVQP